VEQRQKMELNLYSALNAKLVSAAELLRISFHDAPTFHNDESEGRQGGAQGCMRFEHVHGNAANRGLAFTIDRLPAAIGCHDWQCPFSVADILQYAGSVAVEYTGGPKFSSDVKWGRPDAGYLFCLGEL
jgi:catalase (peroxidase I)